MKSFDDWFKNEMPNSYKKVGKEQIETVIYSCSESAWGYKQAEVDELQKRIDEALKEMKHQLGDEDYYDMQRPDYDAMMYSLRNIKDILKGDQS